MTRPLSSGRPNLGAMSLSAALRTMRITWAALLIGQLFFIGAIATILPNFHRQQQVPVNILVLVNLVMLIVMVPAAYAFRRATFWRRQTGEVIAVSAYYTGNLIFWGACEGVSFFALIIVLMSGHFWPAMLIAIAAMFSQFITVPRMGHIKAPDSTFKIE